MNFGDLDHFYTGVAVSVSALRSESSCGIGEFTDIELLGKWCSVCGFEIIQILPVNDTGRERSPYSALSALALHPIYIRLDMVPGADRYGKEIKDFRVACENKPHVDYEGVLAFKLELLWKIFYDNKEQIMKDEKVTEWIAKNQWVKPYAVYYHFKKKYNFNHWKSWPVMQSPTKEDIETCWEENPDGSYFHSWVQYHCENQLKRATLYCERAGIYLKGDIPIMMNEDSADIWMYRKYFNLDFSAGAPPDMFSHLGQNWDFPVFDWAAMEKDNYFWWRMRLRQAAKFYHCYRIDHVLGFFRIFRIPVKETTGILGYFHPTQYITSDQLKKAGFAPERIKWMSVPHIIKDDIVQKTGEMAEYVIDQYMDQINNEPLYHLKPEYCGEGIIEDLDEENFIKRNLLQWYRDRTLIRVSDNTFHHLWNFNETTAYKSLSPDEKKSIDEMIKGNEKKAEKIWAKEGTRLLGMLKESTGMFMCAEDLGAVPRCVPEVLLSLSILSLKIERWTREWDKQGQPYIPVEKYPRLSVCTPSVHDTSTIRGFWELEMSDEEKKKYCEHIKLKTAETDEYTPAIAEAIIKNNLRANSIFCIFQIQDILSLFNELRVISPEDERVNVPGTVTERNWSYRIYSTLEFLINYDKLNDYLRGLLMERKRRSLKKSPNEK
ncbi:MAG: 4-alpha-glucanotransferase [Spirochaetales bacterium]|nr:4-alpha-glucanotransferase [Spirochaetales bacterium]